MDTVENDKVLKIDVDAVLKERLPRRHKLIPRFLTNWLKRTICQDGLNELLAKNHGKRGAEFCDAVLGDLNVSYEISNPERLAADNKVIYVSNHPLGGLDGIAIIDLITKHHGVEPYFLVNDLLMAVKPLAGIFLPINKHGRQSREGIDVIDEAFKSNRPIVIFPAGLVSRRQKGKIIRDLEWKKMFVNYAIRYRRDVIPMFFDGENSRFFYKFAKFRTRIGLKFNIEMIYLPREVFRAAGKCFGVKIGERIAWTSLKGGKEALAQAAEIKEKVYSL